MLFGADLSTYLFYAPFVLMTLYAFSKLITIVEIQKIEYEGFIFDDKFKLPPLHHFIAFGLFGVCAVVLTVRYVFHHGVQFLIFTAILFLLYFAISYLVKKLKKEV